MIRSAARNNAGPMVLANAGTSVVRLRKLVSAFCSIGQRMQLRSEAVRLRLPFGFDANSAGEVRLPESDVAHPADAEDRHQLRPLFLQVGDLGGVGRQLALDREVSLLRRHGQLAERAVERLLHRVLERPVVVRRQRVALRRRTTRPC